MQYVTTWFAEDSFFCPGCRLHVTSALSTFYKNTSSDNWWTKPENMSNKMMLARLYPVASLLDRNAEAHRVMSRWWWTGPFNSRLWMWQISMITHKWWIWTRWMTYSWFHKSTDRGMNWIPGAFKDENPNTVPAVWKRLFCDFSLRIRPSDALHTVKHSCEYSGL